MNRKSKDIVTATAKYLKSRCDAGWLKFNSILCDILSANSSLAQRDDPFLYHNDSYHPRAFAPMTSSITRASSVSRKPPNFLVLADDDRQLIDVKARLSELGFADSHCTYGLDLASLVSQPWRDNCKLLILTAKQKIQDDLVKDQILSYFFAGGDVLSCTDPTSILDHVHLDLDVIPNQASLRKIRFEFESDFEPVWVEFFPTSECAESIATLTDSPTPVIQNLRLGSGQWVTSGIPLFARGSIDDKLESQNEQLENNHFKILELILKRIFGLTPNSSSNGILFAPIQLHGNNEYRSHFVELLKNAESKGKLKPLSLGPAHVDNSESNDYIPIIAEPSQSFIADQYFKFLDPFGVLGRILLHSTVMPTTMTVLDPVLFDLPPDWGAIVVADRQSAGTGRGGNAWLSPDGCSMFTFNLHLTMHSHLGQRVSILQHLVALAIVEAVVERPGYEGVDVKIKWPNDLIHKETLAKLGGILAKSSIMGKKVQVLIGCGINVENWQPTTCLNDLTDWEEKMTRGELMARVINKLEVIMTQYENPVERDDVIQRYYSHWLHTDQEVTVISKNGQKQTAVITGIDDFGFIKAETVDGSQLTLHPDGNSFDLIQNLIVAK